MTLFPDHYKGRPYSDVQAELINQGMRVTGSPVADNSPKNTVLGIDPSGPVPVGTEITVTYSKGPDMVQVPDYSGKSPAAYNSELQALGLVPATNSETSTKPQGTILRTTPAPGVSVAKGSTVTYYVSSGPSATPSPSP